MIDTTLKVIIVSAGLCFVVLIGLIIMIRHANKQGRRRSI